MTEKGAPLMERSQGVHCAFSCREVGARLLSKKHYRTELRLVASLVHAFNPPKKGHGMSYPDNKLICSCCKNSTFDPQSGNPVFIREEYLCPDCAINASKLYLSQGYFLEFLLSEFELRYGKRRRGHVGGRIRNEVLKKFNFRCVFCGESDFKKLTIDHIKPYSKGGRENISNLQVLCRSCNSKKGAKHG